MTAHRITRLAALLPLAAGACSEGPRASLAARNAGYVILLPGVDGPPAQLDGSILGLREAGLNADFEIMDWGVRPFGTFHNLEAIEANRKTAGNIARRISTHRELHPDSPITLIGFSGGGGLAVFAAEAIAARSALDRLILVSPAISPQYNLQPVISNCRRGVVCFYSANDWVILGAGTRVFGTMDRQYTDSAGLVGFQQPDGRLLSLPGLQQIAWQPDWILRYAHDGGHLGWFSQSWARDELAPQIVCRM